jgi:hypothetical protein
VLEWALTAEAASLLYDWLVVAQWVTKRQRRRALLGSQEGSLMLPVQYLSVYQESTDSDYSEDRYDIACPGVWQFWGLTFGRLRWY